MSNMLTRSLGAHSFYLFWKYWNPIWGYFLSRYVMKPANKFMPIWLAAIVTFAVSGALHDIAVTIIKLRPTLFFTPWFALMGLVVVTTKSWGISYQQYQWLTRAMINATMVVIYLAGTMALTTL